eukprot:CAMPEP_0114994782 /NCGR_PEP_ID=MMETSP0216-20121206/13336_1 /TAXON_ID=223996 /ORGANISM="Protocruzia adherens, Strain Boccale" /LENGTH=137 /DNA_ID=CAMNT_0002358693 /DNA_START=65 /DNA_END=478 /DNA_ORIENTATION=-
MLFKYAIYGSFFGTITLLMYFMMQTFHHNEELFIKHEEFLQSTANVSVDFEVYGKVKDVGFKTYSQKKALQLSLVGWVMETRRGTIIGQIQGQEDNIAEMKAWLEQKGSPESQVERVEYKNEDVLDRMDFNTFDIAG